MSRASKVLTAAKANPVGVSFSDLQALVVAAGFELKNVKGSHHKYGKSGVVDGINLQRDGHMAKGYQVRQVLGIIEKYNIVIE